MFLKATLNDKGLVLVGIGKEFLAHKVIWWNLLHAYFCLSLPFLFKRPLNALEFVSCTAGIVNCYFTFFQVA